jgi:ketosteroid isomerase-like protein
VTAEISDLHFTAHGTVAFTSWIDRWVATGSDGKSTEVVFRGTNGLRKINGHWLFVHEHLSVPVDPMTGQADFLSKQ